MKNFLRVIIFFAAFLGSVPAFADHNGNLLCDYSDGYFRVSDANGLHQKYVGGANESAKIACGRTMAAAAIGSYFLVFSGGQFHDQYIGSSGQVEIAMGRTVVGAIFGSYFVSADDGGAIQSQYIGVSSSETRLRIDAGADLVVALMGSYLVAKRGASPAVSQYIGGSSGDRRIAIQVNGRIAGAILGSYFVTVTERGIESKYVGFSENDAFDLVGRGDLVAARMGSYFVVLDGSRSKVDDKYVGSGTGRLSVANNVASLLIGSSLHRYSLVNGRFE